MSETLEPAIIVLDKGRVALSSERNIVCKRDCERCLGDTGAVGQLTHEEMVSGIERTLHGRGRNLEGLEEENIDECNDNHRKNDSVKPIEPYIVLLPFLVVLLPEEPLHLLGDKEVEDNDEA